MFFTDFSSACQVLFARLHAMFANWLVSFTTFGNYLAFLVNLSDDTFLSSIADLASFLVWFFWVNFWINVGDNCFTQVNPTDWATLLCNKTCSFLAQEPNRSLRMKVLLSSHGRGDISSSTEQIQAPLSLSLINLSSPREATKQPTRSEPLFL